MSKNKPKNFDTIAPVKVDVTQTADVQVVEALNVGALNCPKKSKRFNFKFKSFVNYSLKLKKTVLIPIIALIVVSGIISFGYISYENKYNGKAYLGSTVWGEDVGGKTVTEIQQLLSKKALDYKLTIKGPDQEYVAGSADLGLIVNVDEMASQAIQIGREEGFYLSCKNRLFLILSKSNISTINMTLGLSSLEIKPKISFDDVKFNNYIASVGDNIRITAQDSEVKIASGTATLKPAIYGREVNLEKLSADIKNSVINFDNLSITAEVKKIKPSIIDNAAQDVMVQAENVMKRPVILTYQGEEFRPSQETVASWISFKKGPGSTKYELYIDESKMSGYLAFLSTKINIASVPKKVRIENNVKESVVQEGVDGLAVDKKALSSRIATQLPIKTNVKEEISTYVDKFKTVFERVVVENDEKYIVVDISEQRMTAYLKGGQVVNSWGVVTGNPNPRWGVPSGSPTPIGKWLIGGKSASVNMTDGSRCDSSGYRVGGTYCLPGVEWVSWLITPGHGSGYAIHDADDWRTSSMYGNPTYYLIDGSHGCINSPNSVAKFIFDWAPVGTPVYVQV